MPDTPTPPWRWSGGRPRLSALPCVMPAEAQAALPDLKALLAAMEEAQRRLWANRRQAVLVVLQGLDASGKDSLTRVLSEGLDPAGFHAWSFGRPSPEEAAHDFLWRIVRRLPARGEVVFFNRSHYEALLAERFLPDAPKAAGFWKARGRLIREWEQHLVASGTRIIKVWLHTSAEEQRTRLLKRLDDPRKRWKFDPSDIETFRQRKDYLKAMEAAIRDTHSEEAPWHLVPNDDKGLARRAVAQLLVQALETLAPDYPGFDEQVTEEYRKLLRKA
ncbi:PPK2 family polyphosphate kinase [Amnimonas aquatica]|nr:PPK2 family polyphosphate kinase [Amnimonas aquatica]